MAGPAAVDSVDESGIGDFDAWMVSEQRRIFLLCLRMLRDREDAESAAQDAFLKAYRALDREPVNDPSKWITRIAVNTCLDRLRSQRWQFWRRRPGAGEELTVLAMAPAAGPSPEDQLAARQIGARLRSALGKLSARQRSVFVLRHFEDRSLEEIGEVLGLEVGTVKAHMARALAKLREELRDLYGRQALER